MGYILFNKMKKFSLYRSTTVPKTRGEVFEFFSKAENLQKMTPPWVHFEIRTPLPFTIEAGRIIDYRIKLRILPLTWRSEITVWEPPNRFVDEQRKGPFRLWIHEHRFQESKRGTQIEDEVTYAVWGGALVQRYLVGPDLEKIFNYRHEVIEKLFGKI
jgi:ligand-binding SRPBCC domain-containing protein